MPSITVHSIIFAGLIFLTSKFSDHLDKMYETLTDEFEDIQEGNISNRFLLIGLVSKLAYALTLFLAYYINSKLIFTSLGSSISTDFVILYILISVLLLLVLVKRLILIVYIIVSAKSKESRNFIKSVIYSKEV